ncbi:IclR family transcriptional regulator [Roseovarius sp.]|uniref:IclR family transcriptional regulator n=1 Tax=Roseovarius sp. TaxID=1486281 RepID=UPI0035635E6B
MPAPEEGRPESEKIIRAIARGFDVLQAFRPTDNFLLHSQIVERTGLPGPTVTRILHTLQVLRYVSVYNCGKFYKLHPHVLSLGYPVLARYDIRQVARPFMQELADYCRATVALGVRDGSEMIYIERARDKTVVTAHPLDIGSRMPVATSAQGRAWLAGQPSWALEEIFADLSVSYSAEWPNVRKGIERALELYRAKGYVTSIGEWEAATNAVGAPVFLRDGTCLALTCGGPSHRIKPGMIEDLGRRTVDLGDCISRLDAGRQA